MVRKAVVIEVPDPPPPLLSGADIGAIADLLSLKARTALPGGIMSGLIDLSPDKAQLLLEVNTHNRPLSRDLVAAFARMMRDGQWLFNGASLALGVDSVLQDGAHRCTAVVESGVTVPTMIMLGLPPEAQNVTDTGRRRSASDTLHLAHVPNAVNTAATVRTLLAWEAGNILHSGYSIGNIEVATYTQQHLDDLTESVNVGLRARNKGVPISTSVLAAVHFRLKGMSEVDRDDIDAFFAKVCDGIGVADGDPEMLLRDMFMRRRFQKIRTARSEVLYYVLRVWNARRRGERLGKLQLPHRGLRPEMFLDLAGSSKVAAAS